MGHASKFKKILIDSFLPVFAGVILVAGIIFAWNEPSGAPPTGSGAMSISQGNIGIGTSTPTTAKGTGGYLDVKDVFLRDANRWASDSGSCVCRLGSGLQVAKNCGSGWVNIYSSGGSPIAYFRCSDAVTQFGNYLVNGAHTETDCTTKLVNGAYGIVQTDGSGYKFCKFNTTSCSSLSGGWSQYSKWSQTQAVSCVGAAGGSPSCPPSPATSQSTGSHTFSDAAVLQESFLYSDGHRVAASSNDYASPYTDSGSASWWCSWAYPGSSIVCPGGNEWYGICYDSWWGEVVYNCRISVASYCNTVNQRTCSATIQAVGCW